MRPTSRFVVELRQISNHVFLGSGRLLLNNIRDSECDINKCLATPDYSREICPEMINNDPLTAIQVARGNAYPECTYPLHTSSAWWHSQ